MVGAAESLVHADMEQVILRLLAIMPDLARATSGSQTFVISVTGGDQGEPHLDQICVVQNNNNFDSSQRSII